MEDEESLYDLYLKHVRVALRSSIPSIDATPRLRWRSGSIIEICGASGVGKRNLAWHIVGCFVTPRHLNGNGGHAHILDLDGKVDPVLLAGHIDAAVARGARQRQAASRSDAAAPDVAAEQRAAREQVVVHACASRLAALAAATRVGAEASGCEDVPRLVVVSSLGAFAMAEKSAPHVTVSGDGDGAGHSGASPLWGVLARLAAARRPTIVLATKPALFVPERELGGRHEMREFMPRAWARAVSHRVHLWRALRQGSETCPVYDDETQVWAGAAAAGAGEGAVASFRVVRGETGAAGLVFA